MKLQPAAPIIRTFHQPPTPKPHVIIACLLFISNNLSSPLDPLPLLYLSLLRIALEIQHHLIPGSESITRDDSSFDKTEDTLRPMFGLMEYCLHRNMYMNLYLYMWYMHGGLEFHIMSERERRVITWFIR